MATELERGKTHAYRITLALLAVDAFRKYVETYGIDDAHALLAEVVGKARRGAENIDVLCWAAANRRDVAVVIRMLIELRLNEIRCTRFCFAFSSLSR